MLVIDVKAKMILRGKEPIVPLLLSLQCSAASGRVCGAHGKQIPWGKEKALDITSLQKSVLLLGLSSA